MKYKFIIIGAGPAGLAFGAALKKHKESSFLILEKEQEAGGLCRSVMCGNAPLDTGGGHILDSRRSGIVSFVFSYMPENEWNFYTRDSKIAIDDYIIDYPLEAHIWQFPQELQLDYLESIAKAAHYNAEKPAKFTDWIYWKFGERIACDYMLPYNEKIWSLNLDMLGTYWLEKLPNVSFRETLASCLNKKRMEPCPVMRNFIIQKETGFGEVFLRITDSLKEHILYNYGVKRIDLENRCVNCDCSADFIINTAPWHEMAENLPEEYAVLINELLYTSVDIDYYPEKSITSAHWTYFADINLPYHRQINRDNIITGSKGYWTETNSKRRGNHSPCGHFENQYAYSVSTIRKPEIIRWLLNKMRDKNIIGLGRWGEWEHYNSDAVMEQAIELAGKMAGIIK